MASSAPTADVRAALERARRDPVWFERQCGGDPTDYQALVMNSVRDHAVTAVRSCHGVGKSHVAGRVVRWFLPNHPQSIVITTAPTNRQVRGILWKEIAAAWRASKIKLGGTVDTQALRLAADWFAIGFTAPEHDPDRFQGWHARHLLAVVDEACGVSAEIYRGGIDAIVSSQGSKLLLIGNPTDALSEFAEVFRRGGPGLLKVDAFMTPNFTAFGITLDDIVSGTWAEKLAGRKLPRPYLVTPQWVADMFVKCDRDVNHPAFMSRVRAEFPETTSDTIVPIAWIAAARAREEAHTSPPLPPDGVRMLRGPKLILGVDVARFGSDSTVVCARFGRRAWIVARWQGLRTTEVAGRVRELVTRLRADQVILDSGGPGAGVVDELAGEPWAKSVDFGGTKGVDERFENMRAAMYWAARSAFESGEIDCADRDIGEQLTKTEYAFNKKGKIQIEPKIQVKTKLGKSPDEADALVMTYAPVKEVWAL